jgi:hypothetical protein
MNDSEVSRINRLFNLLREGKPIGDLDRYGLIKQIGGTARSEFNKRVLNDTTHGPRSSGHSTWFVGNYGGGKSELLLQIKGALDETTLGSYKLVVSLVDLNLNSVNSPAGIQLAAFRPLVSFLRCKMQRIYVPWPRVSREQAQNPAKGQG